MIDYKVVFGFLATCIALISYLPYIKDVFLKKTRPHAFSWLIWGTLLGIGFFSQLFYAAGSGAWITGALSLACIFIFFLALRQGEKNITRLDWLSLAGAGIALCLWALTKTPLLSVVLITIIDALGFVPTLRKSFHFPEQETYITYAMNGFAFALSLFALEHYSLITVLYPASLVVTHGLFVTVLFVRKKHLRAH